MPQKVYLWILRVGIALSFLSVFLVYGEFLFPYITSKQIYFNVIVEILVVFWIAFIIKYPEWNPFKTGEKKGFLAKALEKINVFAYLKKKKHPVEENISEFKEKSRGLGITLGLIAFFTVMLISTFTGVDFNLSFWGDIERMLGFFHVVHFLFLYFIIITVMRDWEDWKYLLMYFVAITTAVGITGVTMENSYGTVGNKAYMAGFMIFGIFFSTYLLYKEKTILRWFYVLPMVVMLWAFVNAGIAGAFAGLAAGIVAFLFIYGIFAENKTARVVCLTACVLIIASGLFAITNKDNALVKKIKPIQDFSLEEETLQTRFIAWTAAWKDFKNHPVIGTGHGNFAVTFDKHFDADFYNYTRNGTYFDRAHNNLIDIVSTMGILGLLAYLSIFVAVVYYFWKIYKRGRASSLEVSILFALLVAYFVQNLAVFDSLPTYIALMLFLGFVHTLFNTRYDSGNKKELYRKDAKFNDREIFALGGVGILILLVLFQFSYKPAQMLHNTIQGQKAFAKGSPIEAMEIYKESLDKGTVLDRDSRDSFIRTMLSRSGAINKLNNEDKEKILSQAVKWAEANVAYNKEDSLAQMRLAQISNFAARMHRNNKELYNEYAQKALEAINNSIESSPERVPVYSTKAQILLIQNKVDKAIETLEYAATLNEKYEKTYCHLAEVYLIDKQKEKGYENMDKCLAMDGAGSIRYASVVKNAINHYLDKKNNEKVLELYKQLSKLEGDNSKVWIGLAQLHANMGNKDKAIQAARKAANLDSSLKSDVEAFVKSLKHQNIVDTPGN